MLQRLAALTWQQTYMRYLLASAVALGADFASFLMLLHIGFPPVPASMAGYTLGLGVHWLLSSRLVFAQQRQVETSVRHRQKALFVLSALVGLSITGGIVGLGHVLGLDPRIAKLGAIGLSFQATYLLRRKWVFV